MLMNVAASVKWSPTSNYLTERNYEKVNQIEIYQSVRQFSAVFQGAFVFVSFESDRLWGAEYSCALCVENFTSYWRKQLTLKDVNGKDAWCHNSGKQGETFMAQPVRAN